ncbi:MAG: MCE family protein [Myxococcales bacterium]|nr:MCE family protein [Myxococcales bacterium]USN51224.1 MAG: MCE family protein [Myxococcales bacterium]
MTAVKRRSYDLILGLFVAIGLIVLVLLIFLIGRERRLFDSTVSIEAHFPNVAGLALGADVMLSGVVVGHVSKIRFPLLRSDAPGLSRDITVVMEISKSAMDWIREDSIARVDSKGLLGDKIINISIGSSELPKMQVGGMLKSTPPVDFNKALQQAQEILENVTETVSDARDVFKGFVAEGGDAALASSAKSLRKIFKEIESGKGVLHELIYDHQAGKDTKKSITSISSTVKKVENVVADIQSITKAVKDGDGLVHALLYDSEGQKTVKQMNISFAKLSSLLEEIKSGQGVIHDLIYAKDNGQFIHSLNSATHDLALMTQDVKNGKGSLGLLLKDPSLYNEIYGLIGNLRRNRLLKAVIRAGISGQQDAK